MLNLLLGHLVGDFLLQPGWMVVAKRKRIAGLLTHAGAIMLCTGVVVVRDLQWLWAPVLLAGAAHLVVEVVTIAARQRLAVSGATLFMLDQVLHFASLGGLTWLAGPQIRALATSTFGLTLAPTWIALADGVLFVTLLGSILVFEIDTALGAEQRVVLPYDRPRVLGMLERAASLITAFAVHPALAIVPFVPRALASGFGDRSVRQRRVLDLAVGLALSVSAYCFIIAVGVLTR